MRMYANHWLAWQPQRAWGAVHRTASRCARRAPAKRRKHQGVNSVLAHPEGLARVHGVLHFDEPIPFRKRENVDAAVAAGWLAQVRFSPCHRYKLARLASLQFVRRRLVSSNEAIAPRFQRLRHRLLPD